MYDKLFYNKDSCYKKFVADGDAPELDKATLRASAPSDFLASGLLLVAHDVGVKVSKDEKKEAERLANSPVAVALRVVALSRLAEEMGNYVTSERDKLDAKEERTEKQEERLETLDNVSSLFVEAAVEPLSHAAELILDALRGDDGRDEPRVKRTCTEQREESASEEGEQESEDFAEQLTSALDDCVDDF